MKENVYLSKLLHPVTGGEMVIGGRRGNSPINALVAVAVHGDGERVL
jgi:hypothetical protein